ncbi:hypothetical protein GGE65_006212 [Skermanella aerolata]|uniref:hypothetical protein n=1 Tax=Skermanella aerolata TaxID=393310 RepID=UPI003D1ADEEA
MTESADDSLCRSWAVRLAADVEEPQTCPLVLVEWEDSTQPVSSWQWITSYKEPDIVTCASVGWLIHDGADVKALAPNLGHSDEQRAVQVSGVIRIPTRCVTRITVLAEKDDPTSASSASSVSGEATPDRLAAE